MKRGGRGEQEGEHHDFPQHQKVDIGRKVKHIHPNCAAHCAAHLHSTEQHNTARVNWDSHMESLQREKLEAVLCVGPSI